jgi:hypothetical protein
VYHEGGYHPVKHLHPFLGFGVIDRGSAA